MVERTIKVINKRTYVLIDGKWFNEKSNQELDPHDPDYSTAYNIKRI
tara:strand:- start:98 stop:238 length:141 start_codon:yes stop_codon:yes gene_type:complete